MILNNSDDPFDDDCYDFDDLIEDIDKEVEGPYVRCARCGEVDEPHCEYPSLCTYCGHVTAKAMDDDD